MSERLFATQGDVMAFLHGLGLKVGRTKISTDYRAGRLKSTPDKRFREEDVLAYAESLKAPAAEERAGRERKLRAERDSLKTLLAALLRALPDEQAVASALETWLRAHEEEGGGLCGDVWKTFQLAYFDSIGGNAYMINRIKLRHRYRSIFFSKRNSKKICKNFLKHDNSTIHIPKKISILRSPERELLFSVVRKIHKKANKHAKICLDFSITEKIYTEGMIYLYAEIDNILNIYKEVVIRCRKSRIRKVNHILYQIGIFRLCSHSFSPSQEYQDVVHWKKSSGFDVNGSKFDEIIGHDYQATELIQRINIYGGFIEAIKNACIHAYIKQRELSPVAHKKVAWWVFSQVNKGVLFVSICDLGIGIPATVPEKFSQLIVELKKKFGILTPADIIKAAIERPSSRTKESYRGNGLKTIAEIAKQDNYASFSIISDKGYVYSRDKQLKKANFTSSLPGTIVSWKLPLKNVSSISQ